MLVIGNDHTFNSFVQEYAASATALTRTQNADFSRKSQVYLIPSGCNTLAHFIASREPMYRQNVFQFFSQMNKEYSCIVKPSGFVADLNSIVNVDVRHLMQLYDRVVQTYLRDAKRSLQVKVFRAKVHYETGETSTHYFTNRIEIGS